MMYIPSKILKELVGRDSAKKFLSDIIFSKKEYQGSKAARKIVKAYNPFIPIYSDVGFRKGRENKGRKWHKVTFSTGGRIRRGVIPLDLFKELLIYFPKGAYFRTSGNYRISFIWEDEKI